MKLIKICIRCGNKGILNIHGVCKECVNYDQNKMVEPKAEDYGWLSCNTFDGGQQGWQFEGGEDAYYEALKDYKNQQ